MPIPESPFVGLTQIKHKMTEKDSDKDSLD